MSFAIYLVGFLILMIGVIVGANMLHVPPRWIAVGATVLLGAGILSAVQATRNRDS